MPQGGSNTTIKSVVDSYNRDEKEEAVAQKAAELDLPYLDLRQESLAPDTLSLISVEEAQKGIIPISKKGKELTVGVANPNSPEIEKVLEYLSKFFNLKKCLISWESVKDAIPSYRGLHKQKLEEERDYEIKIVDSAVTFKELEEQLNTAPLKDILKAILAAAVASNSSDIHIEPQKEGARVRFRIDGVLHVVGQLKKERYDYLLSQTELASGMKLNVDEAQEGRLEANIKGTNVNIRVETMPTLYGDDIALRLFNITNSMLDISSLGLSDATREIIESSLDIIQGMILVVGPTGAGKTTTIYAILNRLNQPGIKIITLEDPIEYTIPGISQSQINEKEGFSKRLKAVLREDPDIVMVGEIRDAETADVALHAALTGHLMISTFHAVDTAAALGLLREITDNNSLLSAGIKLLISQRLVRKLCQNCKKEVRLTAEEYEYAQRIFNGLPEEIKEGRALTFYESEGCEKCEGLGFKGRTGIFEVMPLNVELQKLISRDKVTVAEIKEAAKKSGMITMAQDGILKAIEGTTSVAELIRVIGK